MTPTVVVVAKAPIPGRSKTRLTPPLAPQRAADVQRALLLDTIADCRREGFEPVLLYADPAEAPLLTELGGGSIRLERQEGRGLADALSQGVGRFVGQGPVALVSSDLPGLPEGSLRRTFAALEDGADVVLGPALDGGYWLIAMDEPQIAPFREIPWSTPAVFGVTARRCEEAGLELAVLEPWRDVDTAVDLDALLESADELGARHTARVLAELAREGAIGAAPPNLGFGGSELLDRSPWRAVVRDRLVTRDGRETTYTYLAVPRAVFVVPVTDDGALVLVRQYRHPVRDWTLEVPAGSVAEGESPLDAARRELSEEAGGHAREWRHLSSFFSSSAHISLRSDAFLASGVRLGASSPDEDEEVSIVRLPIGEAITHAREGLFSEGQTALAILLAAPYLEGFSSS